MRHALDCSTGAGSLKCDCMGAYRVLKPIYTKTGTSSMTPDGVVHWNRVDFEHLGYADGMEDALRKFPRCVRNSYSPVLEFVGRLH